MRLLDNYIAGFKLYIFLMHELEILVLFTIFNSCKHFLRKCQYLICTNINLLNNNLKYVRI